MGKQELLLFIIILLYLRVPFWRLFSHQKRIHSWANDVRVPVASGCYLLPDRMQLDHQQRARIACSELHRKLLSYICITENGNMKLFQNNPKLRVYRSRPIMTELSSDDDVVIGVTWTMLWTNRSLGKSSIANCVTCDFPTLAGPRITTGTLPLE